MSNTRGWKTENLFNVFTPYLPWIAHIIPKELQGARGFQHCIEILVVGLGPGTQFKCLE